MSRVRHMRMGKFINMVFIYLFFSNLLESRSRKKFLPTHETVDGTVVVSNGALVPVVVIRTEDRSLRQRPTFPFPQVLHAVHETIRELARYAEHVDCLVLVQLVSGAHVTVAVVFGTPRYLHVAEYAVVVMRQLIGETTDVRPPFQRDQEGISVRTIRSRCYCCCCGIVRGTDSRSLRVRRRAPFPVRHRQKRVDESEHRCCPPSPLRKKGTERELQNIIKTDTRPLIIFLNNQY